MRQFSSLTRRRAAASLAAPLLAACGAQTPAASPGSGPSYGGDSGAAPAAAPTTPPPEVAGVRTSGALTFRVQPQQSKATFRVREQLARIELPSDAVGTTGAVEGQLSLGADGSIDSRNSRITVDLRELATDSAQRDNFIKRNTLQTEQFPHATFIPTRADSLPTPLPERGQHSFRLTGPLTIHGVEKEVTWDTTASRDGNQLTGKATTSVKFGDFGMEPPKVPVVLSVTDEIRLELDLVATL